MTPQYQCDLNFLKPVYLIVSEAEMKKYTPLSEARFDEIRQTDKNLERAYELYFTRE